MSCVTLVVWSIAVQKGTDILIFYILEHGAECNAESSSAK